VAVFVLPFLFLSLFFYALVHLQEAVLGQVIVEHQHIRVAALAGILGVAGFVLSRFTRVRVAHPRLTLFATVYACYLVVEFLVRALTGATRLGALIYGETYLYFFVFFILFLILLSVSGAGAQRVVVERGAFRLLHAFAVPTFFLGYAQFILNDPLLNVSTEGGYDVEVYLSTKLHHVRAFSLFGSPFTYAHFITLIATLALSALLIGGARKRNHLVEWLFLIMATLAVFTTYTRNAYLEFLVALGGVLLIRRLVDRGWRDRIIITLSAAMGVGLYAGIITFFFLARTEAGGLFDLSTFSIRLLEVGATIGKYVLGAGNASSLLFGYGLLQGPKFAELQGIRPLLFDNTYLDVFLFSGMVGLLLYLTFLALVFSYVLQRYRQSRAHWWLALAGLYFAYPAVAAINIHVGTLFLLTSIVVSYDILATRRLAAPNKVRADLRGGQDLHL